MITNINSEEVRGNESSIYEAEGGRKAFQLHSEEDMEVPLG